MKVFMFFVNCIYWLWAFIVPVILCGLPAWFIYEKSSVNLPWSITLLVVGVICGVWVAERIRKKTGLSSFFSRLSETPDIKDSNEPGQQ